MNIVSGLVNIITIIAVPTSITAASTIAIAIAITIPIPITMTIFITPNSTIPVFELVLS